MACCAEWGPALTQLAAKIALRSGTADHSERRRLSRESAHDMRRIHRVEAVARLAKNVKPRPKLRPYHALLVDESTELLDPEAATEAIEDHIDSRYWGDGSVA